MSSSTIGSTLQAALLAAMEVAKTTQLLIQKNNALLAALDAHAASMKPAPEPGPEKPKEESRG